MWWKYAHDIFQYPLNNISWRIIEFKLTLGPAQFSQLILHSCPIFFRSAEHCTHSYFTVASWFFWVEVRRLLQCFENLIKRSGNLESSKNSNFRPSRTAGLADFKSFCCIYEYTIWYSEFPLLSEDYSATLSGKWHVFVRVSAVEEWVAGCW